MESCWWEHWYGIFSVDFANFINENLRNASTLKNNSVSLSYLIISVIVNGII